MRDGQCSHIRFLFTREFVNGEGNNIIKELSVVEIRY